MSDIGKAIDGVVSAELAPYLKSKGFKKRARDFYRVDHESIALINVQASQSNFGTEGKFTLNVGRYFPTVSDIDGKSMTGTMPKEYECTIRQRIGTLRDNNDHWWSLTSGSDSAAVSREVRKFAEAYAMPWLARTATIDSLRSMSDQLAPLTAASVALLAGDKAEAARIANEFKQRRPAARAHINAWAERNAIELV